MNLRNKLIGIRNEIKGAKSNLGHHLDAISNGAATGIGIGLILLVPVLAVNAAFYSILGGIEGTERAFGVRPETYSVKLKEKKVAISPTGGGRYNYGIFEDSNGKKREFYDYPVVTELSFLPNNLENMQVGHSYSVKTFGPVVKKIIEAKEIK